MRELYVGGDGREHTRAFLQEGCFAGSLLDLLSDAPSVTWIEALEPTEAVVWPYRGLESLCERFPELQVVMRRYAERLYVRKAKREHDMMALSATERYEQWLRDEPLLDERLQRRHVASYLGMSPEFVSRLRRRARSPRAR